MTAGKKIIFNEDEIMTPKAPVIIGEVYREIYDFPYDYDYEEESDIRQKRKTLFNSILFVSILIVLIFWAVWNLAQ